MLFECGVSKGACSLVLVTWTAGIVGGTAVALFLMVVEDRRIVEAQLASIGSSAFGLLLLWPDVVLPILCVCAVTSSTSSTSAGQLSIMFQVSSLLRINCTGFERTLAGCTIRIELRLYVRMYVICRGLTYYSDSSGLLVNPGSMS